jgi:hypothetical protein
MCLRLTGCYIATTKFLSKQDTLGPRKLVLSHTLVALQATSRLHNLFNVIHSINCEFFFHCVICNTSYRLFDYYNGFIQSKEEYRRYCWQAEMCNFESTET